jgi:hypothetical protein
MRIRANILNIQYHLRELSLMSITGKSQLSKKDKFLASPKLVGDFLQTARAKLSFREHHLYE